MFSRSRKVAVSSDVVTQKQRCATFGTHAPASATAMTLSHSDRNQILLGGRRRGACRLSPGLHRTSHQSAQAIVLKMNVHRLPVNSVPIPRCAFLSVSGPSKWSSTMIDDPEWQGDCGGDDGGVCWGNWAIETLLIKAIRGLLSYFSNPVSEFPLTYHCELLDEDSA